MIGTVALVTVLSLVILWKRRPPAGALEVCERFASLVVTSKCSEAYKFSLESTYPFSSVDSFCKQYQDDYAQAGALCRPGHWEGGDYVVEGMLDRSRPGVTYPAISFGMVLRQVSGEWYVARWTMED